MLVWKATSVSVNQGSRIVTVTTGDDIDSITINSWIQIGSSLPYEIKRGFLDGSTKKLELFEPWAGTNLSAQRAIAFPTRSEVEQLTQNVRDLIQSIETLENYSEFTRDSVVNLNDAASWRTALQVIGETDTLTTSTGLSGGGNMSVNRTISVDASTGVLGVGSGEVRSNRELNNRYLKKDDISDASLVLDFANNDYRVLENGILTRKSFGDILSFTRNSTASIWSPNKLNEVGVNIPRASSFDPTTGEPKGIDIEESRTNLLIWSQAFQQLSWVKDEITATDLGGKFSLVPSINSSTGHRIRFEGLSLDAGVTYCCFFDVEPNGYDAVKVRLGSASASFDIVNKTIIGNKDAVAHGIIPLGGNKVRCWVASNSGFDINDRPYLYISSVANINPSSLDALAYAGDGVSGVNVYRSQVEQGSFPTSYVPTEGTTVTRAADICTIENIDQSDWWNPNEGTFVIEFESQGLSPSNASPAFYISENGGILRFITLRLLAGGLSFAANNEAGEVTQIAVQPQYNFNQKLRCTFAYNSGFYRLSVNGDAVISVVVNGALPNTLGRIGVGCRPTGGQILDGTISELLYEPVAVSDARLQELSTL